MGPGRVMMRSPRTLKYSKNPQILDEGLEVQMEWLGRCGERLWTWDVTGAHNAIN